MIQVLLGALVLWGSYLGFRIVYQLFGDLQDALEREREEAGRSAPRVEGMTVNARLEAAGLREEMHRAVRARDQRRVMEILRRLD